MANARARILVVDDERFFREAICEALQGEPVEIGLAGTAREAFEALEVGGIAVVVLDIQLPDRSGLDVLRHLRTHQPEVRVVVLSAHTDQEYVLEALRLGACDYLAKPLHEEELRLSVRRAVEGHAVASGWRMLQRRLEALAGQLHALLGAAGAGEAEGTVASLVEAVARTLDVRKASLMLLDEKAQELRVVAAVGRKLAPEAFDAVRLGEGVVGWAVARGESLWVTDVAADARFPARVPNDRYETSSFVVAPVQRDDRCWGALCATDRVGGAPFTAVDSVLLRLLALVAGSLLGRVPRDEETAVYPESVEPREGEGDDAELARQVCEVVTREIEPDRLLVSALQAVGAGLGAAPVSLYLVDSASGALRREAQWEGSGVSDRATLARGRGLTGAALETGHPVAALRPGDDPRFDGEIDTPEDGALAVLLVVPLRLRGKTLGCVRAFPQNGQAASPRTAEVLGAALSAAVRNVLLYRSLIKSMEEVARIRREGASASE